MITKEQRERRRSHIGSSDVAAIIGADPWRTAADVYWSKVGDLADDRPNAAMQLGNRMEKPILDFAEEKFGPLHRDVEMIDEEYSLLVANLDGLLQDRCEVVEAKYVGPRGVDNWGQDGSDEVPDHVFLQTQFQMRVADAAVAHVVAAIVRPEGLSFECFHVGRDEDTIDSIVTAVLGFWKHWVQTKTAPPKSLPSLETLKRIRREPSSVIELRLKV